MYGQYGDRNTRLEVIIDEVIADELYFNDKPIKINEHDAIGNIENGIT